jgi:hypothetical protein
MSVSQRFFFGYFNVVEVGQEFKLGDHKHDMTDAYLSRLLHLTGGHQRTVSLARCYRLTSAGFQDLSLLTALWHLDISYTACSDIRPLRKCTCLRSLNISGLSLGSYGVLAELTTLEVLCASFCAIQSTAPLGKLTRLRSLNLGFTQVADTAGLAPCARLEELLLDGSQVQCAAALAKTVAQLPRLRLLGVGATPCAGAGEKRVLQASMPPGGARGGGGVVHTHSST